MKVHIGLIGCGGISNMREDCTDVIREGIRTPVEWGERHTLEGVTSEEIQLRFTLYGRARLYSFTFTS